MSRCVIDRVVGVEVALPRRCAESRVMSVDNLSDIGHFCLLLIGVRIESRNHDQMWMTNEERDDHSQKHQNDQNEDERRGNGEERGAEETRDQTQHIDAGAVEDVEST